MQPEPSRSAGTIDWKTAPRPNQHKKSRRVIDPPAEEFPFLTALVFEKPFYMVAHTFSRAAAMAASSFLMSSMVLGWTSGGLSSRPYFHLRNFSPVVG